MRSLRQSENVRYSRDKKPGRFWNSMTLTSTKCLWLSSGLLKTRHGLKHFPLKFCLFVSPFSSYQEIEQADTFIGERKKEMRRVRKPLQEGPWSPPACQVAERRVLKWTAWFITTYSWALWILYPFSSSQSQFALSEN